MITTITPKLSKAKAVTIGIDVHTAMRGGWQIPEDAILDALTRHESLTARSNDMGLGLDYITLGDKYPDWEEETRPLPNRINVNGPNTTGWANYVVLTAASGTMIGQVHGTLDAAEKYARSLDVETYITELVARCEPIPPPPTHTITEL